MKKGRGRPPSYDREQALDAALAVFWRRGFEDTSLDRLREAMGMNRPSIYGAFGDKKALYGAAVDRFRTDFERRQQQALREARGVVDGLRAFFACALSMYTAEDGRGCMVFSTTVVGAANDPQRRALLADAVGALDDGLIAWFSKLQEEGEVDANADVEALAELTAAALMGLSVRARAGIGEEALGDHLARVVRQISRLAGAD